MNEKIKEEFGSSQPVRFLGPENVTMYDSEGNEIEIPKCEICGSRKQELMDNESSTYFMTQMTQQEFEEKLKGREKVKDFVFNMIQHSAPSIEDL